MRLERPNVFFLSETLKKIKNPKKLGTLKIRNPKQLRTYRLRLCSRRRLRPCSRRRLSLRSRRRLSLLSRRRLSLCSRSRLLLRSRRRSFSSAHVAVALLASPPPRTSSSSVLSHFPSQPRPFLFFYSTKQCLLLWIQEVGTVQKKEVSKKILHGITVFLLMGNQET